MMNFWYFKIWKLKKWEVHLKWDLEKSHLKAFLLVKHKKINTSLKFQISSWKIKRVNGIRALLEKKYLKQFEVDLGELFRTVVNLSELQFPPNRAPLTHCQNYELNFMIVNSLEYLSESRFVRNLINENLKMNIFGKVIGAIVFISCHQRLPQSAFK